MSETRKTSIPALSVFPRVGISRSASETDDRFYLSKTAATAVVTYFYSNHVTIRRQARFRERSSKIGEICSFRQAKQTLEGENVSQCCDTWHMSEKLL